MDCGIPFIISENNALLTARLRIAFWCLHRPAKGAGFFIELFMSKDPAVLLYTSDFLTGTSRMSDEQVGQYIRALCSQHQGGHFLKEELSQILKSYDNQVWSKFIQDDDGKYYNERMEKEIIKRQNYCNSRSHPELAGRPTKKLIKSYDNHTNIIRKSNGNHTENENDNINVIKIEDRSIKFLEEINTFKEYDISMLNEFYSYWSEPNKSKTKMRYELQPTWDLKRRLKTWSDRQKMKPQQRYGRQEVSREELREQFDRIKLS